MSECLIEDEQGSLRSEKEYVDQIVTLMQIDEKAQGEKKRVHDCVNRITLR